MQITTENGSGGSDLHGLDGPGVWDSHRAFEVLQASGQAATKRTAERRLHELGLLPAELDLASLRNAEGESVNTIVAEHALE